MKNYLVTGVSYCSCDDEREIIYEGDDLDRACSAYSNGTDYKDVKMFTEI